MKRAGLAWYRLRFPRELTQDAALAALASFSGAPHGTRLVFDLSATSAGITHRLAVSQGAADIVGGSLRAAIPSLRLDVIQSPEDQHSRRLLWQLQPALAAIRVDDQAAISGGLLSALFPLREEESLRLTWTARPARRPLLATTPDDRREGRARALRAKLALPGLGAYGDLLVQAATPTRQAQLIRRVATALWSLRTPHGQLVADTPWQGQLARLVGLRGRYLSVQELAALIGWPIGAPDLPGLELA